MLDRTLTPPRDLFIFMGDNINAHKGGVPMTHESEDGLRTGNNDPIEAGTDRGGRVAEGDGAVGGEGAVGRDVLPAGTAGKFGAGVGGPPAASFAPLARLVSLVRRWS